MVVDTKLYDVLGVHPNAPQGDIKRAYQRKALELHPDKNQGDPHATEKFQALNEAYDILKDPKKRQEYDQMGFQAMNSGDSGMDADSIFSSFMGGFGFGFPGFGFGNGNRKQRRQKTEDMMYTMNASLEELYLGATKTIRVQRSRICEKCKGKGVKKGCNIPRCSDCNGTGSMVTVTRHGSVVYQQQTTCPKCRGTGEFIQASDQCRSCHGQKVVQKKQDFQVHISPGMEEGENIVFRGEADEFPDADSGDLIVTLKEKPHPLFAKRNHSNLLIYKEVTLSDAILGVRFPVKHLDGRTLIVSASKNDIVLNNSIYVVENEGMPIQDNPYKKGKLFIKFNIVFPKQEDISPELADALREVCPMEIDLRGVDLNDENVYEVTLEDSDINEFRHSKRTFNNRRDEAYHQDGSSDEEESSCRPM